MILAKLKKRYQKQLNQFHDFYFGITPKPKSKPKPDIAVDEKKFSIDSIWYFNDKNPFKRFKVAIKDVREGHILYRHCVSRSLFQEESCSIEQFIHMYKKKEEK